jgi:hypothetical protein
VATAIDCALTNAGFFGNVGCSTITLTGSGTFVVPASGFDPLLALRCE